MIRPPPIPTLFPYTTLFRSDLRGVRGVKRALLEEIERTTTAAPLRVVSREVAPDGFVKYLFEIGVEAVRIPVPCEAPGADVSAYEGKEKKYIVCVSSQAGCALACSFCATGALGFRRNLTAAEIVGQVLAVRKEADRPVRGVVFMGMGEPFLNYDNVIKAARILSHPDRGNRAADPPLHGGGPQVPPRRLAHPRDPVEARPADADRENPRHPRPGRRAPRPRPHAQDARPRRVRPARRRERLGGRRESSRRPPRPKPGEGGPDRRQRRHRRLPPGEQKSPLRLPGRPRKFANSFRNSLLGRPGGVGRLRPAGGGRARRTQVMNRWPHARPEGPRRR